MALAELLKQCEQRTHHERMQFMVEIGRQASTSAATKSLVQELCNGNLYEQLLGLQTCHGTRDVTPVLQALRSRSTIMRKRAINYITILGSNDEVAAELQAMPAALRGQLLKGLCRCKRFDVIDAYLIDLGTAEEDREKCELFKSYLPLASVDVIRLHLPRLLDTLRREILAQLAQYHPELAFTVVRDQIARTGKVEPELLAAINVLLTRFRIANVCRPTFCDLVVDVLKRLPKSIPLAKVDLSRLIEYRPREAAQVVIERGEKEVPWFAEVFSKLLTAQVLALQQLNSDTISPYQFGSLNEEQRLAVYEVMRLKWRDSDGHLSIDVVGGLPEKEKIAEARRNIALPKFEVNPLLRIPFIALLPWDEAMPLQWPFIRSGDANVRSSALASQMVAASDQPAHLSDALALVLPRGREQDPVRRQFLWALSRLPAWKWEMTHLEPLTRIIRDALDALDLSSSSVDYLLVLTAQLLNFHTKWASAQLALIIGERREIPDEIKFKKTKAPEIMKVLSQHLLPVLEAFRKQEEENLLVRMAAVLKTNLEHIPAFVDMVEEGVLLQTKSSYTGSKLLELWSEYQPKRLPSVIPRLLDCDPGWVALKFVDNYVQEHGLTAYMNLEAHKGRFGPLPLTSWDYSKPRAVPRPWQTTKSQQEAEKVVLVKTIEDRHKSVDQWQCDITKLAELCFVDGADKLIEFSSSDDRTVVREASTRALGYLDDPGRGIPTLLEALNDNARSRIAIYSLGRALKSMPKSEALAILRTTPLQKVTVAKEVIRLAGDIDTDESYAFLVGLSTASPPLHRDALIALLKVLAPLLSRPAVTTLFQLAAAHAEASVPTAIVELFATRSDTDRLLWNDLTARMLSHPLVQVRHSALGNCCRNLDDSEKLLTAPLFKLLHSSVQKEPVEAAVAVMRVYGRTDPELLVKTFEMFLADRAVLTALVQHFNINAKFTREGYLASTMQILTLLASTPLTLCMRVSLIFFSLPGNVVQSHILNLGGELHADALVKAEGFAGNLGHLRDVEVEALEAELGKSADDGLRRLGLAVLAGMATRPEGWTTVLRDRLDCYRRDGSVLVAEAAVSVFPPKVEVE